MIFFNFFLNVDVLFLAKQGLSSKYSERYECDIYLGGLDDILFIPEVNMVN